MLTPSHNLLLPLSSRCLMVLCSYIWMASLDSFPYSALDNGMLIFDKVEQAHKSIHTVHIILSVPLPAQQLCTAVVFADAA